MKQNGFTLIELMLVLIVIGILASIAIPTYFSYARTARFSEVVSATGPYKNAVSMALQSGIPAGSITLGSNGVPSAPAATTHLSSLTINNGIITATGTAISGSFTYVLTPNVNGTTYTVTGTCVAAGVCPS